LDDRPDDDLVLGKAYDARLARRLLRYLRPLVGLGAGAVGLTLLATLLLAATPYLLGLAVDAGIRDRDARALGWIAAAFIAAEALRYAVVYAQTYILALIGQRITLDLRMELFEKLEHQSMAFFARQPVGRLVTRLMNDVATIGELFSTGVVTVLGDVLTIVADAVILFLLDPRLAVLTLLVVPPLALSMGVLNRALRRTFRELRKLLARVNAYFAESLNGIRVIQIFGREDESQRRFRAITTAHLEQQLRSVHLHAVYVSVVTILTSGAVAAILGVGGAQALAGAIELGVIVSFIGYAQQLFQPVRDIAEKYAIFQAAMASAERVFHLIDEEVLVRNPARCEPLETIAGEIEFRDVSFRYPRRPGEEENAGGEPRWALRHVSFRVRAGERVAIVGHTGAGKSTIVSLLGRFYDVTEGAVLVDGRDVRTVDKRALRRRIGIVLQDVFIFAGSVLDNIRLGDERIPPERAREAARVVGADRWIARLPRGFDEEMRERGATLSTGEKQLLSFARALAFDPRVLVLDEATASVDPETESLLQAAVRTLMRGRTSIVIAHRLSTIQDVDRVLVFHKGELREEGTVPELLARKGIFHALYRLQQVGKAAAAPPDRVPT
jgi:ATP-binding cassette subfamily B protein